MIIKEHSNASKPFVEYFLLPTIMDLHKMSDIGTMGLCVFFWFPEIRLAEEVAAAILDCSDDEECDVVVIPPDNHAISDEEAVDDGNLDDIHCKSKTTNVDVF